MTRKKINGDPERKLIINLIVNSRFCKEILPLIRPQYFLASYTREISTWISEYYSEFSEAPGKDIKSIYYSKKRKIDDNKDSDLISDFLSSISKEYESLEANNIDYEIKNAKQYIKLRSLEVLKNSLDDSVNEKNPEKGEQAVSNYKRVESIMGQGIDLFKDTDAVSNAIIKENNIIITFPGALGKVIQPISRGDFVSFFGPAKRGKSHWLWYSSDIAMTQQNKVLLFTLEMTEHAIIRRAWPSLTGIPLETKMINSAKFVRDEDDENYWSIEQKKKKREGFEPTDEAISFYQKKLKRIYRKGAIKIIAPPEPLSVSLIESTLDNLAYYENYSPDVIVIDYADYMVPSKGFRTNDHRNIINNIWQGLRLLSIQRNIAVITASHTNKITFDADIKTGHASEDIRKINNVTMAIGLNQTKKEYDQNIMRVVLMEIREGKKASDQAVVLQCLDLGRPCLDSRMRKEVIYEKDEENEEKPKYSRKKER